MKTVCKLFCIIALASAGCGNMPRNAKAKSREPILTGPPQPALYEDGARFDDRVNRAGVCGVKVVWNYSQGYVEFRNGNGTGKVKVDYRADRKEADASLNLPAGAMTKVYVPFREGEKVVVAVNGPDLDRSKCNGSFLLAR